LGDTAPLTTSGVLELVVAPLVGDVTVTYAAAATVRFGAVLATWVLSPA